MIQLYTGVPGAGKTYKMVADLDAFLVKEPDINLIANIRALKLPHQDFDKLLNDCFPDKSLTIPQKIELFFDYDYQQKLNEEFNGPIMYILDECQLYFPRRTSLPNTEAYLQRHRHLGHYLYLATQSSKLINSNIVALIEIEYYAVRRSISLFGEMHYRSKSPQSNQIIKTFTVRPKKRIFNLYKSFEAAEITKPKREIWRKLWPLVLVLVGGYFFYTQFMDIDKRAARYSGQPVKRQENNQSTQRQPNQEMKLEIDRLRKELDDLRKQSKEQKPELERVFLPVVQHGKKKLTIDPDTQAVVEVERIASLHRRQLHCVNDGLTCYYDRPVNSGVRVAGEFGQRSMSGSSRSTARSTSIMGQQVKPPVHSSINSALKSGSGSFVEPSMVPAPETPRR